MNTGKNNILHMNTTCNRWIVIFILIGNMFMYFIKFNFVLLNLIISLEIVRKKS